MTIRAATCTLAAIFASACVRSGDASFSGGPGPSSGSDSGPGNQDSSGSSTGTSSTSTTGSSDDSAASMPAMSTGTFGDADPLGDGWRAGLLVGDAGCAERTAPHRAASPHSASTRLQWTPEREARGPGPRAG